METAYIIRNGVIIGEAGRDGKDGVQISDNETVEDKTWSSKKTRDEIAKVDASLGELEGKVNNLSHIKFATVRSKTNIDEILNIGTMGVYYQLYDSNSTGTKPTNADKSGIVKTEVWDNDGKYAVQEYDEMNTGNRKYMRYFNNGTWSDWQELATMDKVDKKANIIQFSKRVEPSSSYVLNFTKSAQLGLLMIEGFTPSLGSPSVSTYQMYRNIRTGDTIVKPIGDVIAKITFSDQTETSININTTSDYVITTIKLIY